MGSPVFSHTCTPIHMAINVTYEISHRIAPGPHGLYADRRKVVDRDETGIILQLLFHRSTSHSRETSAGQN